MNMTTHTLNKDPFSFQYFSTYFCLQWIKVLKCLQIISLAFQTKKIQFQFKRMKEKCPMSLTAWSSPERFHYLCIINQQAGWYNFSLNHLIKFENVSFSNKRSWKSKNWLRDTDTRYIKLYSLIICFWTSILAFKIKIHLSIHLANTHPSTYNDWKKWVHSRKSLFTETVNNVLVT